MFRFPLMRVKVVSGNLQPETGLSIFLHPQPKELSTNPSNLTATADSLVFTEVGNGQYYVDIENPTAKYDLYVDGVKDDTFSGTTGFSLPSTKSIYFKKNVAPFSGETYEYRTLNTDDTSPDYIGDPDGGQSWPKFDNGNLPYIILLAPSEPLSGFYPYRYVTIERGSVSVTAGILEFTVTKDSNGPALVEYYFDLLLIIP